MSQTPLYTSPWCVPSCSPCLSGGGGRGRRGWGGGGHLIRFLCRASAMIYLEENNCKTAKKNCIRLFILNND